MSEGNFNDSKNGIRKIYKDIEIRAKIRRKKKNISFNKIFNHSDSHSKLVSPK